MATLEIDERRSDSTRNGRIHIHWDGNATFNKSLVRRCQHGKLSYCRLEGNRNFCHCPCWMESVRIIEPAHWGPRDPPPRETGTTWCRVNRWSICTIILLVIHQLLHILISHCTVYSMSFGSSWICNHGLRSEPSGPTTPFCKMKFP